MTGTWNSVIKWFFYITAAVMVVGSIVNIVEEVFDIFQLWVLLAFIAGIYLLNSKK